MKIVRRVLLLLALLVVIGVLLTSIQYAVINPTRELRAKSDRLRNALSGARSVTLVEFSPYYFDEQTETVIRKEVMIESATATPEQIQHLLSATAGSLVFDPSLVVSVAGCYNPHHGVNIVRRDGSAFRFEVCFECGKFRLGSQGEESIQKQWLPRLRQFFTDAGMAPRPDDDYAALASRPITNLNHVTP